MSHHRFSEDGEQPGASGAFYEIRVQEQLDPLWADRLEDVEVHQTEGGETILCGRLRDQPALHGLLARIRDLNLTLIRVDRVEGEVTNSTSPSRISISRCSGKTRPLHGG